MASAGDPAAGDLDRRIAAALERERRVSGRLGAHALAAAYAAVAAWCALVHPWPGAAFYLGAVAGFVGLAWLRGRRSPAAASSARLDAAFVLANAALLTVTLLLPNPLDAPPWPEQVALRAQAFPFLLILVAWAAFTLSPGLVVAAGVSVVAAWSVGVGLIAAHPDTLLGFGLPQGAGAAPAALERYLDPRFVDAGAWASGAFVTFLVAGILATATARVRRLVRAQARIERARANLARHLSPNLVEELAEVDRPLGPVRTQAVAVLFVDVVGFTALCEGRAPEAVVRLLRGFHGRMAACVFDHGGTLDKFMGDSVMATFGTPRPGPRDAADALACARAMLASLDAWNLERTSSGESALRAGIGLHYGPAVLGDIGDERRVEFAVLGDTVNTASRLEALTRTLGTGLVASEALVRRVRDEAGEDVLDGLRRHAEPVRLRGRAEPVAVWLLGGPVRPARAGR